METTEHNNPISEYVVSPLFRPFREVAKKVGGAVLEFPLKVAEDALNAPIEWTHDAVAAIVGFPVKKGK